MHHKEMVEEAWEQAGHSAQQHLRVLYGRSLAWRQSASSLAVSGRALRPLPTCHAQPGTRDFWPAFSAISKQLKRT